MICCYKPQISYFTSNNVFKAQEAEIINKAEELI